MAERKLKLRSGDVTDGMRVEALPRDVEVVPTDGAALVAALCG